MAHHALLIAVVGTLASCATPRVVVVGGQSTVLRDWEECAFAHDKGSVAGIVRDADGQPLEGAWLFFDDVSKGERTRIGAWRPTMPSDSPDVFLRPSDSHGRFWISDDARAKVRGVALLGVMARGYQPGSVAWATPPKHACMEFILSKQAR